VIPAAATLLLLRTTATGELEVLMVQRAARLSFMGGMWVFPGGRVDAADASAAARERILPAAGRACDARLETLGGSCLDSTESIALHVAACRETFEETGVLLAVTAEGEPVAPGRVTSLQPLRAAIAADAQAFIDLLQSEDLYLDVAPLVYWSHWVTPSIEPKRFDTRFFAVALPEGQSVSPDLDELTEHAWIQPLALPALIEQGRLRVVPPTLLTLEDLAEAHARHGTLSAMLAAERGRAAPPILPRIEICQDAFRVVMPWDADYASIPGEGCQPAAGFPPHLLRRRSNLRVARQRDVRP